MVYRKTKVRVKANRRKTKRWYVDASLPKSLPFFGGSSFRAGSGPIQKVVRRELDRQEETKQLILTSTLASATHNTIYSYAPLQSLSVGTAPDQRVGLQVWLKHIKIKGQFMNPAMPTSSQVRLRLMGMWVDKEVAVGNWGAGVDSTDLFHSSSSPLTEALINNKREHIIICDKTFTLRTDFNGQNKTYPIEFDCPINRKITYKQSSTFLKDKEFYMVAITSVPSGVSGTTVTGTCNLDFLCTFKDS